MTGVRIDVDARADKAQRDLTAVNESLRNIQASTGKLSSGLDRLAASFGALAAGSGAAYYIKTVSDNFTNLRNQIRLAGTELEDLNKTQSRLVSMSIRNRAELTQTARLYSTLGRSMAEVGVSSETILKATDTLQKAVALSGSNADSASAAIFQLSQGLSSGTLRGEELNSVLEQTSEVARTIADGLGVSIGQLRALGAEGQLTSSTVFGAILSQSDKVNEKFAKMAPTLDQSLTVLNTSLSNLVGEFLEGANATNIIAGSLASIATSLQDMTVSARAFGAILNYEVGKAFDNTRAIVQPIAALIGAVFKHTVMALPRIDFTRTMFGDFKEGLRLIDDAVGGTFTRLARFMKYGLYDLLTYDSAAEAAIKKIKRLSPTEWLTGGLDAATIKRVFSTHTLKEYGRALDELTAAIAANPEAAFVRAGIAARRFGYTMKDAARYLGMLPDNVLTFRIGDIDAFNYSLTELLRGITGIQLKFTDVKKLLREIFNTSTTRLQLALEDIALALPRLVERVFERSLELFKNGLEKLKRRVKNIFEDVDIQLPKFEFSIDSAKATLLAVLATVSKAVSSTVGKAFRDSAFVQEIGKIVDATAERLSAFTAKLAGVLKIVVEFGKKVIYVFKEIWDEVVGHSWWPDTIDGVVEYAEGLADRVAPSLGKFEREVNSTFEKILVRMQNFDAKEVAIDIKLKVDNFKAAFSQLTDSISKEFPTLLRGIGFGIAALLLAAFAPMNAVVVTLITDLGLTAVSQLGAVAEKFSKDIFGSSFAQSTGESIGALIGIYVADLIAGIPGAMNLIVTAMGGFFKAFLSQVLGSLPLGLGSLFGGIFDILYKFLDLVGLTGPAGLIGTFFLGRAGMRSLAAMGIWEAGIRRVFDMGTRFLALTSTGGVVSKFLFGASQGRLFAGLAAIMAFGGAFDSLFGGSLVLQYGSYGLIAYYLLGGNPAGFATRLWATNIAPLFSNILGAGRAGASALSGLASSLLRTKALTVGLFAALMMFMSSSARAGDLTSDAVRSNETAFDRLRNTIVDFSKAAVDLAVAEPVKTIIAALFTGITAAVVGKTLHSLLVLKRTTAQTVTDIASMTKMDKVFATGKSAAGAVVDAFPSIGKFLSAGFERVGKVSKTILEQIKGQWVELTAIMSAAWTKFAGTTFGMKLVEMLSAFTGVVRRMKVQLLGLATRFKQTTALFTLGTMAAGATILNGGSWDDAIGSVVALGTVWSMIGAKIRNTIAGIMGRIAALVGSFFTLSAILTTAIAAVAGGVLAVLFFGEGDTFMDKLDDVWQKLKRIMGMASDVKVNDSEGRRRTAEFAKDNSFIAANRLESAPSLIGVDFSALNKREQKAMDDLTKTYVEAMEAAKDEYAATGRVSDGTRERIRNLVSNINVLTERVIDKTSADLGVRIAELNKRTQPDVNGWWDNLKHGFMRRVDAGSENTTEYILQSRRRMAATPEEKLKLTKEIDEFNATKYKRRYGYSELSEPDARVHDTLTRIKRPNDITDPALRKAFRVATLDYEQTLKTARTQLSSTGFTDANKRAVLGQLSESRNRMQQTASHVLAREQREDAVRAFSANLDAVKAKLKAANVEFDEKLLVTGSEEGFKKFKEYVNIIEVADKKLKETSKAEGVANFVERIEQERIKLAAAAKGMLELQQSHDKAFGSPQAATQRLNEALSLGLDKDALAKISADTSSELMSMLHDIERLKMDYAKDLSVAEMIFPANTPEDVKKRIQADTSKAALLAYIDQLSEDVRRRARDKMKLGDFMKSLADTTGLQFSGADLAGDNEYTSRVRLQQAAIVEKAKKDLEAALRDMEASQQAGASPSKELQAQYLAAQRAFAQTQRDASEAIKNATPAYETFNEQLERLAQNTGLSVQQLNKLPKKLDLSGQVDGADYAFVGSPAEYLKSLDSLSQRYGKALENHKLPEKDAIAYRVAQQHALDIMKDVGRQLQLQADDFVSAAGRINSAGGNLQFSDWFAIEPEVFKGLDRLSSRLAELQQRMNLPTNKNFLQDSEEYARLAAQLQTQLELGKTQVAAKQFGLSGFSARMSTVNSTFGGSLDRNTYARSIAEFDALTQAALELEAAFARLPEDMRISSATAFDRATENLKQRFAELAEQGPDVNKNLVNKLNNVGVSTDLASANRLTDRQRDTFSKWGEYIREQSRIANDPSLDAATRQAAQRLVDRHSYKLSEELEFATMKFTDTPAYQAGESFAYSVKSDFSQGMSSLLTGDKTFSETLRGFADTFTKSVINTFISGMTNSIFNERGPLMWSLRELGMSLFNDGGIFGGPFAGAGQPPEVMFSSAVDRFAIAVQGMGVGSLGGDLPKNALGKAIGVDDFDALDPKLETESLFSKFTSGFKDMFGGIFDSLKSRLGGMMQGLLGMFSGGRLSSSFGGFDLFKSIAGLFLAGGGAVSGPGTSTSDSVPAWLSTGEFVVNAAQTSRFRPLLEQINSGRFPKFATGGFVGGADTISSQPTSSVRSSTFNINITGDISRQTRREIISMLPEIASGVNNHNYEQGVK